MSDLSLIIISVMTTTVVMYFLLEFRLMMYSKNVDQGLNERDQFIIESIVSIFNVKLEEEENE